MLLNFNSSDYSSAELDTFFVSTINIQTGDTATSTIINTMQPYNYVTLDMLTKYSPTNIINYKFLLQLKDTSKTITLEQINLLFEPEDKDGCCDCDKFLFQSVMIDDLTYVTVVLPLEVNK